MIGIQGSNHNDIFPQSLKFHFNMICLDINKLPYILFQMSHLHEIEHPVPQSNQLKIQYHQYKLVLPSDSPEYQFYSLLCNWLKTIRSESNKNNLQQLAFQNVLQQQMGRTLDHVTVINDETVWEYLTKTITIESLEYSTKLKWVLTKVKEILALDKSNKVIQ